MRYSAPIARLALNGCLVLALSCLGRADQPVNILINGGAEQVAEDGALPSHWYPAARAAEGLRLWRDTDHALTGNACFAISNGHSYNQLVSNNWAQRLPYIPFGRAVRLSGHLRTQDAEAASMCVQCWGPDELQMVGFTSTRVYRGTHDWTLVQTPEVVVPPTTAKLVVRTALTGKGEAYFDDLTLQIVGEPALTDSELKEQIKGRIVNVLPVLKDCMILAYMPEWAHGNVDNIAVANNGGGVRTLLAWQKPQPKEVEQPNLQFLLAMYLRDSKVGGKLAPILVHEILEDWNELSSWEKKIPFAPEPAAHFEVTADKGWKFFDVTSLVRRQTADGESAFGVVLRFADENYDCKDDAYLSYGFVSRDGIGPWENRRPVLLVVDSSQPPADEQPAVAQPTKKATKLSSETLLEYIEYLASLPEVPIEVVPGAGTAYFEAVQEGLNSDPAKMPQGLADAKARHLAQLTAAMAPHEYFVQRYPLTPEGLLEMSSLASLYGRAERLPDALRLSAAAAKLGANTNLACILEINFAWAEAESGDLDGAERRLRRVMAQPLPADSSDRRSTDIQFVAPKELAKLLEKKNQPGEAERQFKELVIQAIRWNQQHPDKKEIGFSYAIAAYRWRIDSLLRRDTDEGVAAARELAKEFQKQIPDYRNDRMPGLSGQDELEHYIESSLGMRRQMKSSANQSSQPKADPRAASPEAPAERRSAGEP